MSSPASNLVNKSLETTATSSAMTGSPTATSRAAHHLLFLQEWITSGNPPPLQGTSPPSPKTNTGPASSKWTGLPLERAFTATPSKNLGKEARHSRHYLPQKPRTKSRKPRPLAPPSSSNLIDKEPWSAAQAPTSRATSTKGLLRKERAGYQVRALASTSLPAS